MKLIGNLNVNNKVSVGTYDAGESTLLVYGGAHFGKGARKSKQDDVLSFNAADGAWNTYFELVQDSWSGSHGLLFNAVKEPGSFEGNLELSGHTTYPFSHNPTSNQAHAGLLAFYGNGGGRYVFNISNQKDGFVEGDDIDWDRVFLLWKDSNDREKNYAQLNGQIKIVDGTQGNNKVLTSDADGLATWEDIRDNSYTLSYNSKTAEISLLDSEGRVVSTITHRDLDFQQLTWNGSTYDLTISNGNTVNLSELVGGMVADTNTYVSSGQLNGTNLDLLLSDGSSVSSIDLSDLLDDTNLWSPKPSGNNIYRSIGNVGIGTSTPDSKLHVDGQVKIVDGSEGVEKVLTSDASGLASWEDLSTLLQNVDLGEDKYLVSGGLLDGTPNGRCNTKILKLIMSDASEIDIDVSQLIRDNYVSNLLFDDATNILTLVHSTPDGCGEAPQQTIDLSSLAGGGADTYLASASLAGNILQLGLNTGTDYNVDLSSLAGGGNSSDADWKISGNDMYSEPTGNVGIGKDTPQSKLHVKDNNAILTLETIANAGGNFIDYTDSAGTKAKVGFISDKTEDFYIWNTESNGAINLINSPGTMALSAQNGQVGIGGIGPLGAHSLSVEGTTHLKETNRNDVLTMTSNDSIFSFGGVSGVGNKTNNVILQHRPQSGGANSSSSWQTRAANTTEKPEGEIAIELTTYFTNNGENIDYNAVAMNSGINKINILGATNRDNTAILSLQSDSKITFQSHSISWPSDSRETMTIDIANDKVGINQSSPDVDLHINGQIKIVDGSQGNNKVLTSDANGLASWQTPSSNGGSSVPVGSIIQFAGDTPPPGWLMCDGAAYEPNDYFLLFNVIGFTYGQVEPSFNPGNKGDDSSLDGGNNFRVPLLSGKIPVGKDNGDSDFNSLGDMGGEKTVTLSHTEVPYKEHTHTINDDSGSKHHHEISWVHDGQATYQTNTNDREQATNVINLHHSKRLNAQRNLGGLDAGYKNSVFTGGHQYYPNGDVDEKDSNWAMNNGKLNPDGEHTHTMDVGAASSNSNGSPHNNLQPYIVLNYIIYAGV